MGRWKHPDDMVRDLSAKQIIGWLEYNRVEPFFRSNEWFMYADMKATVINMVSRIVASLCGSKDNIVSAKDFMPESMTKDSKRRNRKQSAEEMANIFRSMPHTEKES